jgi:replicative DNA helicase
VTEDTEPSRGLPGDWDTERAVLGGLLIAPDLLDEVRAILKPEHFQMPRHQRLFQVISRLADAGIAPSVVSVPHAIQARRIEGEVGGVAYVIALGQASASVETVPSQARLIRRDWERRDALLALRKAEARLLSDPDAEPSIVMAEVTTRVDANVSTDTGDEWKTLGEIADDALREIQLRAENPGKAPGLSTGFPDLDRKLGGLRPSRVYVLAARPKMGKTALVLQMALTVAKQSVGVGFVSLEMARGELAERALANEGCVDAGKMVRGEVRANDEWRDLLAAAERLATLGLYVSDRPAQTMAAIRAKAKRLAQRCAAEGRSLGLLVVDYLQLMGGDAGPGANREQVISGISRGLKLLSKEMEIPIVVLSQLSRKVEERAEKRPMPSDLRESGAIEQDADAILFIYRDEVYNPESPKKGIA